ncbi:MAG TPA: AsmA-like C-terminal region-containing protein, partial [Panacibacter sp.]|nr:AsmA-like C-terminal region-containing protein [Panacibacter sp.]
FSDAKLSFFNHFPALTLTMYNVVLKGSAPFQKDTLIAADELALGVDLASVFESEININQFFLTKAFINVQVNEAGEANYNVYKSTPGPTVATDTGSASLKIENIVIEKSNLVYNDRSLPMFINAKGFSYTGKGDLSKAIFDLYTHAEVDSLDFSFDNESYVLSKKINADLVTQINTNSLALEFQKNDLRINKLPVNFNGRFEFLKNGYNMDFKINSKETKLYDLFTALPPQYLTWLTKTDVKGTANVVASLSGKYIAETNTMPDFQFNMKIRDGYLSHENAPSPVSNLFLDFETKLPGLNTDSLSVNIDSVFFNIDKDYFSSVVHIRGLNTPYINAKVNTQLDLEKWDKAFGIQPFDVKGNYKLQLLMEGNYATTVIQKGLRGTDTVISSIPVFNMQSSFNNGYFKYASLPQAVSNISFNLNASCPDSNYHHASLALDNINATALGNFIKGYFKFSAAENFPIDANIQTVFHLADIKQFYPLDSIDLKGDLNIDLQSKGNYNPDKKLFPVTKANINLQNGSLQTNYYPHPIEKIQVVANVLSTNGSMQDLAINILPVSFEFEGQPFQVKADLKNFDNLSYNISSDGIIDIGKIYKVFAQKGYDVKGYLETNLTLRGLQSDATSGRYNKLFNSGTVKVKEVTLSSDLFPKPFLINTGLFRFNQDKMWFDEFKANYGGSDFSLNGYLSNVINYALKDNEPLKGNFDLKSNTIITDEFMAFADSSSVAATSADTATGVIIVPQNLDMEFTASAKKVLYNGLELKDFKGRMNVTKGQVILKETGFNLIGAPVTMDATYGSISPTKAVFDYHIKAENFDVKKAYNEIKIFHDMATAAASAEGIVSIDYQLAGKLDASMYPVYPSLKGGGVLTLQQVKMKGFKLLGAVSKETGKDSINDPNLAGVNIKSTIANNIITIERTKMRIAGFRPRFEGQVSLDGKLNLKFRLGLPPLGIFGIPMTITGTQDKPIVTMHKGNESDKLEETEEEQ